FDALRAVLRTGPDLRLPPGAARGGVARLHPSDADRRRMAVRLGGARSGQTCDAWALSGAAGPRRRRRSPGATSQLIRRHHGMCRNIKTLHNFEPPAMDDEIRASALQFVRKLSGFTHPSKANEAAFERAVDQ